MNLKTLTDSALLSQIKIYVEREREMTLAVLHHLREVETRRAYAALGFSSLFDYATRELGYCAASAARRIAAMRLLKKLPGIEDKIQEGSLSLTAVSRAQTFFKKERFDLKAQEKILTSLENKSTREVEKTLLRLSSNPEVHFEERVRLVTPALSEVKFYADDELLENLEKLKGLLAHSHPGMSTADLIKYLAEMGLKKLDPAKQELKSTPAQYEATRYVPRSVKHEVFKRDGSRCTYIDPKTGRRCTSIYKLQLDHKIPWAAHGRTDKENLRILCQTHNLHEAKAWFGRKFMRQFTEK